MGKKYSDDVLNMEFSVEVFDGIKPEKTFFTITEDTLKDVYHVTPNDSVEEARKKIMDVVSKDEFLYKYFNKDPRFWELRSFEPGYWTTPAKEERVLSRKELIDLGYSDAEIKKMRMPVKDTHVVQTFQQKLTIKFAKRDLSNILSDDKFLELYEKEFEEFLAHDTVTMAILKNKFNDTTPKKNKTKYDPEKLLVIPDVELHIGKLASKFDSTDSYDYKKALYRYMRIILEAEKVQNTYHAKEICMTIGNDFFNTDTEQNTTTAGTEQHNDTRFQQMIVNGIVAHFWAVERMKSQCDKLILKFNPGNHDYLTDYMLFMQLYMVYKNDPKVEIEPKVKESRWATSLVWHNNLVIFAHGKTPEGKAQNDDQLALLKDTMFKAESKGVDNIVVHAGHLHNSTENNFSRRKTASNGVTVVRNGSPSGDGAWDSGNMYSSDKSHQVYVYDAQRGLYSTVNIKLTREELEKGISVPSITDDTDYLKTIEKSIGLKTEDIILDDIKKLYTINEKQIKLVDKKYEKILRRVYAITDIKEMSEEKKEEMLSALGYDEEIRPLLETRESLIQRLHAPQRKLVPTNKSSN